MPISKVLPILPRLSCTEFRQNLALYTENTNRNSFTRSHPPKVKGRVPVTIITKFTNAYYNFVNISYTEIFHLQ